MGKGCVDRRRPSCLSAYCASCTTAQRNPDPVLMLSRTTRKPPTHLSFAARNRYESALAHGGLSIGVPVHSRRASRKTRRSLSIPISDHVSFDKSITGAGVFRVLLVARSQDMLRLHQVFVLRHQFNLRLTRNKITTIDSMTSNETMRPVLKAIDGKRPFRQRNRSKVKPQISTKSHRPESFV